MIGRRGGIQGFNDAFCEVDRAFATTEEAIQELHGVTVVLAVFAKHFDFFGIVGSEMVDGHDDRKTVLLDVLIMDFEILQAVAERVAIFGMQFFELLPAMHL